jgi:hypothetical protein
VPYARRPPRLTAGGPTWDLRGKRGGPKPGGGPKRDGTAKPVRGRVPEADALMMLNDSIAGIVVALNRGDVLVSRELRRRALKYAALLPADRIRRQRRILDELRVRIERADAPARYPRGRRPHRPPVQRPDVTRRDPGPASSGASAVIEPRASLPESSADQQSLEVTVSPEIVHVPRIERPQQSSQLKAARQKPATTATGTKDVKWAARQGRIDRKAGTARGKYEQFRRIYGLSDSKLTRRMWTAYNEAATRRKKPGRGSSVWTVSGGLPSLGKRAR